MKRILLYTLLLVVTLFAIFTFTGCDMNEYTVTLVQDEHATISTEKTTYRKGETVVVTEVVDPGYYCITHCGNVTFYDSFEMPGCDTTVTAIVNPIHYRIEYAGYGDDYNNHYGELENYFTVEDEVSLPTAVKSGYRFAGWYLDESLTTPIKKIEKGTVGNITLYPKFTLNTYTLNYHLPEGATTISSNRTSYSVNESEPIVLYDAVMDNREFLGWYDDPEFSGGRIRSISPECAMDFDLYPKFLSTDYTDDGYRIIRNKVDLLEIFNGEYDTEGKYILEGDIEFGKKEDGVIIRGFKGTFNGNGHKITGLKSHLFDTLQGATVENLTFSSTRTLTLGVSSDIERNVGCLADEIIGTATVYIRNVHLESANVEISVKAPLNFGGFIGMNSSAELIIDGCTVKNLNVNIFAAGSTSIGGILGYGYSDIRSSNVFMDSDDSYCVELTKSKSHHRIGGMIGHAEGGFIKDSSYSQEAGSVNFNVYATEYCSSVSIGGLAGYGSFLTVEDSYSMLRGLNLDSDADGLSGFILYMAGLVARGEGLMFRNSGVEVWGYTLALNCPFEKWGVMLRFYYGYFSCSITEANVEGYHYIPESITNNGSIVSSAYIEDDFLEEE